MRYPETERSRQNPTRPTNATTEPARRRSVNVFCNVLLLVAPVLVNCQRTSLSDGLAERQDCSACHGSSVNAAPPQALNGSSSTTDIGVGAHQAHLIAGHVAAPVPCVECHPLPADLLSHPDMEPRPAQVVFGTRASQNDAKPKWNRDSATCNTYCHGSTLSGAEQRSAPIWTQVDGSYRSCTSCHGFPPGGSHPTSSTCIDCHGSVAGTAGRIIDLNRHIDGIVDF
jgi:predicted CxxxxCH...CXXCH cytochrome family protein